MAFSSFVRRAGAARALAACGSAAAFFVVATVPNGVAGGVPATGTLGRSHDNHAAARVRGSLSGTMGKKKKSHFLYAEDGTCPDGIDVFKIEGTKLSHVQTVTGVGCSPNTYFGTHHLAVVTKPSHCLIYASVGDGFDYSFSITDKTGKLSKTPVSSVNVGGRPSDLAVSGSTVFESNPGNFIDVLQVGSGCKLTLLKQNLTGNSEVDYGIALTNSTTVVAADENQRLMVAYKLGSGGTLTEPIRQDGQIFDPQGIAVLKTSKGPHVFTGQSTDVQPQTQGFTFTGTAFNPLKNSPQISSDETAENGAAVAVSGPNDLLAQAFSSGQIGWDHLTATGMKYTSDTKLAKKDAPTELTVFKNTLFVAQAYGGDLESCKLAPNKVSGCHTVATLTGAGSGDGGSTAVFSPK